MSQNNGVIVNRIRAEIPDGTAIPKPNSSGAFTKRWGRRRNEPALVYSMPNHKNPASPHEKGIAESEFERAYHQLNRTGEFTREWFKAELPRCNKEGTCNFTTIGGIFELLGDALYSVQGSYKKNGHPSLMIESSFSYSKNATKIKCLLWRERQSNSSFIFSKKPGIVLPNKAILVLCIEGFGNLYAITHRT